MLVNIVVSNLKVAQLKPVGLKSLLDLEIALKVHILPPGGTLLPI